MRISISPSDDACSSRAVKFVFPFSGYFFRRFRYVERAVATRKRRFHSKKLDVSTPPTLDVGKLGARELAKLKLDLLYPRKQF